MKKSLLFFLCMVILAFMLIPANAQTVINSEFTFGEFNYIVNGEFDSLAGWTLESGGGGIVNDAYSGTNAYQISSGSLYVKLDLFPTYDSNIINQKNTEYTFRIMAKPNGEGSSLSLSAHALLTDGSYAEIESSDITAFDPTSSEWQQVSINFTTSEKYNGLQWRFLVLKAEGTAVLDKAEMIRSDYDTDKILDNVFTSTITKNTDLTGSSGFEGSNYPLKIESAGSSFSIDTDVYLTGNASIKYENTGNASIDKLRIPIPVSDLANDIYYIQITLKGEGLYSSPADRLNGIFPQPQPTMAGYQIYPEFLTAIPGYEGVFRAFANTNLDHSTGKYTEFVSGLPVAGGVYPSNIGWSSTATDQDWITLTIPVNPHSLPTSIIDAVASQSGSSAEPVYYDIYTLFKYLKGSVYIDNIKMFRQGTPEPDFNTGYESVDFSDAETETVYGTPYTFPSASYSFIDSEGNKTTLDATITMDLQADYAMLGWTTIRDDIPHSEENRTVTFDAPGTYRMVYNVVTEDGTFEGYHTVTVKDVITGIIADTQGMKTVYKPGEKLSTSGLIVKMISSYMPNGSVISDYEIATDYSIVSPVGVYPVTVSYKGYSCEFNITVNNDITVSETYTLSGQISSNNPNNSISLSLTNGINSYDYTVEGTYGSGETVDEFSFNNIVEGIYDLTVEKAGHLIRKIKNINIEDNIDLSESVNLIPGDINADGFIDSLDVSCFLFDMGKADIETSYNESDINGDTYRDGIDVAILSYNLLKSSPDINLSDVSVIPSERVSLFNASLLSGDWKIKEDINAQYLKQLDADRILYWYREESGLSHINTQNGYQPYPDWESDPNLKGITLGHYISACSMLYSQTGDRDLFDIVEYCIEELDKCQSEDGFVLCYPLSRIESVESGSWDGVPYYFTHKVLAGCVDAYLYCGNEQALEVASQYADWIYNRMSALTPAQVLNVQRIEYGGISEPLYALYNITGSEKALEAARFFNEKALLDAWASDTDNLDGLHANTTIPKATGFMLEYLISGDRKYLTAVENFFEMVVDERLYANGGSASAEYWKEKGVICPYCDDHSDRPSEICAIYNMIKLAQLLYEKTGEAKYYDYIEFALSNGIMGSISSDGGKIYDQYFETNAYKAFHGPQNGFWCCTGSGMENFTKVVESVYYNVDPETVRINGYISSSYTDGSFSLDMLCEDGENTITVTAGGSKSIELRVPYWSNTTFLSVNGEIISDYDITNGYVILTDDWSEGDIIVWNTPFKTYTRSTPDDPNVFSIYHGPYLLAVTGNVSTNVIVGSFDTGWLAELESAVISNGNGTYTLKINDSTLPLKKYGLITTENYTVYLKRIDYVIYEPEEDTEIFEGSEPIYIFDGTYSGNWWGTHACTLGVRDGKNAILMNASTTSADWQVICGLLAANGAPVDISKYESISVDFYTADVSTIGMFSIEISSTTDASEGYRLIYQITPDKIAGLKNGWNTVKFNVSDATIEGEYNPKSVRYIRTMVVMTGETEMGIGDIIGHGKEIERTPPEFGDLIYNFTPSATGGWWGDKASSLTTIQGEPAILMEDCVGNGWVVLCGNLKNGGDAGIDISAYTMLSVDFYVSNASTVSGFSIEICDTKSAPTEGRRLIYQTSTVGKDLKNGWNRIEFAVSDATIEAGYDPTNAVYMRIMLIVNGTTDYGLGYIAGYPKA